MYSAYSEENVVGPDSRQTFALIVSPNFHDVNKYCFYFQLPQAQMHFSLVASPMCPIGNPEMLSTSNFYDGNVIYMVWKDKLA